MHKIVYFILLATLAVGCGSGAKHHNDEKKVLTVTIEPQRFFLDQMVGELFTINTLVPPGSSPETYEPAPSVMIDMADSDIYFMVGDLGFENAWSTRLKVNNPEVTIVNCSDGIERMEGHDHSHCEGELHHDHGDHHHDHGEDHAHSHAAVHAHSGIDPHVWSSPQATKIVVENMLKSVVELDPENEETIRANYAALTNRIDRTDSLIKETLKDIPSRSFIIYHPALGYFARDFGLQQVSIEFEGKSPSPAQIKEIVDLARKENINTIFIERGFDTKNASVVAKEIGAEIFEIDPLRYEWDEELLRIATILARNADE